MIDRALEEIKEFVKDKKLVECKGGSVDIFKNIESKGMSMLVLFEYAFRANGSNYTKVPCICLKDGTISYFNKSSMIRGEFACKCCRVYKDVDVYTALCKRNSIEYIEHSYNGSKTIITGKCKYDGEICKVSSDHLRSAKVICDTCVTNKYIAACNALDYEYLSTIVTRHGKTTGTRVLARCKHDGYIRSIAQQKLCDGRVRCRICQVEKYQKLLSKKNCKYIRHYGNNNNDSRIVYSTKDGEEYDVSIGAVLESKFPVSRDNSWYQEHSVYAIEAKDSNLTYIKIGTANIPEVRHKGLKILCESSVKTLATFPDRFGADKLETYLHKLFKQERLNRRVVNHIVGSESAYIRKSGETVMVKDGATEWFSGSIAETLYSLDFSAIEV